MTTFYLDYVNGSDANDGSSWAQAWKTLTNGATAARIAPGDIIRIAKSPAPVSIGNGTWTNQSKTVTLATAQTTTIDLCETIWTADHGTVALTPVATDAKQGSYCMKITCDSVPAANERQAYYNCADLDLSTKQKISFWIKNEVAIANATDWVIELCSDDACTTVVDTFAIPAIPSTGRWIPLTIARNGGGNLGASIKGIRVSLGSTTPTASKYIYIDDIIACTTDGLNLQSLISKNSAEQGGTEGWYGIQSIDGVTVLLDNETNTKANAGKGYSTSGTSPETVTTYIRETIKTAMAATSSTVVQEIMDSGTLAGGNIQFQGGYDTSTSNQTGETFFDGLSGYGYGIQVSGKLYITLNYINVSRYYYGMYFFGSHNNTILTITNASNVTNYALFFSGSNNNTITTVSNINNSSYGINLTTCYNNTFETITNANNNLLYGVYFNYSHNNTIKTITNANNNNYGLAAQNSSDNIVLTINTAGNSSSALYPQSGWNYIDTATLAESVKASGFVNYADGRIFIQKIGGYANIWYEYGNIVSQGATAGGSGIEWVMNITNTARASNYPLKLKLAEFAAGAGTLVTVTCYFKKSHATDIVGKLVLPGGQIGGPASDTVATCPSDTVRNQLSIQFTPSAAGVFYVEGWAYWAANLADENVIIDDIAISQA